MKLSNELAFDFGLTGPKITATAHVAIIDNIRQVAAVCDTQVVVDTGRFYVTVSGSGFVIREMWEGRMELEGDIRGIEFYQTLGPHQAAGI